MHGDGEARQPSRPISTVGALAWTMTLGFVSAVAVQVTESARPGATGDLVNITTCFVLAYSLLLFAMLRVYAPDASVRDVFGVRAVSPVGVVLAGLIGAGLYPGMEVLDAVMTKRFPPPPEETELIERLLAANTLGERVVLVASLVVVLPVCEELFFRGALFGGLRRGRPESSAVLAAAALFAVSRGDVRSFGSALALGLAASWVRGRSGSIGPAIAAHAASSVVPLVPLVMGKTDYEFGPKAALLGLGVAAVAGVGAGLLFQRDARAERGRLLDP